MKPEVTDELRAIIVADIDAGKREAALKAGAAAAYDPADPAARKALMPSVPAACCSH